VLLRQVYTQFGAVLTLNDSGLFIPPQARALTRIIARALDAYGLDKAGHSSAI
jgi:oxygen-independent coproporphyrinogen-3 oxidase